MKRERGQSIVEFAIILPFLLLLIIGMAETAFALRSYLMVNTACREGIRFAARGRYTDEDAARWMIASGGYTRVGDAQVPFFRTTGPDANTAIIIYHIPIRADGTVESGQTYVTGTVCLPAPGGQVSCAPASGNIDRVSQEVNVERHRNETITINNQRAAAGYERLDNQLIVVDVIYGHRTLWNYGPLGLPPVLNLHARSVMRVVSDARQSQVGGGQLGGGE